jgi:aspartate/methionine/tyrosine aminotransferase
VAIPFALTKLVARTGLARWVPAARRLTGGRPEAVRYFSDRLLAAPVDDLLDPALAPADGPDVIDLGGAAPRFASPVGGRLPADRGGWPPAAGLPALRDRLADLYRQRDGRAVGPADVLVTHGATGAFAAVLDAFVNPGDRVVLLDPCSPLFRLGAASRRARVRWVPTWDEDGRTRYLETGLRAALRGAKLVVVADPGNPTGGTLSPDDRDRLAWWAARHDVLVYLDESFAPLGVPSELATRPGAVERTLSAGSLSPGYGLGSVRLGWLAGPRHLVGACTLAASLSAPFVPTACQQLALRVLDDDPPGRDGLTARRRYAVDRLRAMGLEPAAAGGLFVWLAVPEDGRAFAGRLLAGQRVRVTPGDVFGPSGGRHVRLGVAADDGRLREGLARLAAFVGRPAAGAVRVEAPVEAGDPAFDRM